MNDLIEPEFDKWVLPAMLEEQARLRPDDVWISTTDGDEWTFSKGWEEVQKVASWFEKNGVGPGDKVAIMLPNGLDFVRAWLGLGSIGGVAVLLNTELRGTFLAHQVQNSGACLAIVDGELASELIGASGVASALKAIAVTDCDVLVPERLRKVPWSGLAGWQGAEPQQRKLPGPRELFTVIYTSGTTGPAKGVLMPHAHCALWGIGARRALKLEPSDCYYITLPLFHANGLLMQLGATLLVGMRAVLRRRFSASSWLNDIRTYRATVTNVIGVLSMYILSQTPSHTDKENSLRLLFAAPMLPEHEKQFRERFGVRDVLSGYGMSEVNMPVWGRIGVSSPGAAGWPMSQWFEVIIADSDTDLEVPRGTIGEILVRPKVPFAFMQGYLGMPEKTAEATRNLWFHSGDAGYMDDSGLIYFKDRIKDCIRRRGENISATEVEFAMLSLDGIAECAAFAVPSSIAGGEDELMLAIVKKSGLDLQPETVFNHADISLPRFAQLRFLRFVDDLPKTASGKVQRALLKSDGLGSAIERV